MVLVTGPTGSGKTTTLYAALNEIKTTKTRSSPLKTRSNTRFAASPKFQSMRKKPHLCARLRSILRHDPDKILVGEIRDQETRRSHQLRAHGHLVFTTVQPTRGRRARRFLNMGVEATTLSPRSTAFWPSGSSAPSANTAQPRSITTTRRSRSAGSIQPSGRASASAKAPAAWSAAHRLPRQNRDPRAARSNRPHSRTDS